MLYKGYRDLILAEFGRLGHTLGHTLKTEYGEYL